MQRYINFTGESSITHYEIGEEYILIKYKKGILEYRSSSNSKEDIEAMKVLAKKGSGLSRYISKHKIIEEGKEEEMSFYKRLKSLFSSK